MNDKIKNICISILRLIAEKKLSVGDRIPSEVELAREIDTNRMNAHRALEELKKRGLFKSQRRHGTFIRKSLDLNEIERIKAIINKTKNCYVLYSFDEKNKSYWDQSTLSRLEKFLVDKGYSVLFKEIGKKWDANLLRQLFTEAKHENSAALIIFSGPMENTEVIKENNHFFSKCRFPVFLFSQYNSSLLNWFPAHLISIDHYSQGILAGAYLKECKHNKVVYLSSQPISQIKSNSWNQLRLQGVETEFCRNDSTGRNKLEIIEDENRLCSDIRANVDQTIIVADCDWTAKKFIDLAQKNSLVPSEDFQIISFDNRYEFRNYNLTTIGNPLERTGEIIGRLVCNNIDSSDKTCIRLSSELFERQTMRKRNFI